MSLRYRLLIPVLLLLFTNLILTAWAAGTAASTAEQRLNQQRESIQQTVAQAPTFPLTQRVLEQLHSLTGAHFLLTKPFGEPLQTFPYPLPAQAQFSDDDLVPVGPEVYRMSRLTLRAPHPNEGSVLTIGYPESLRQNAIRDAIRPPITLGILATFLSLGLTWFFGSRMVIKIRAIQRGTRTIAAGQRTPLPVPAQRDEVRELVESVNEMARDLQAAEASLRQQERLTLLGQFSGGLAHQLRNASAGARLAIQLVRTEADSENQEALNVALRQLDRIEVSLKQFLDLGKPPELERQWLAVRPLLVLALDAVRARARHAQVELILDMPQEFSAYWDGEAIQHILGNLLTNALDALTGPGTIILAAIEREHDLILECRDTGPGPPAAIADNLFDLFVTGRKQGIGLGLALAKQLAEAHDGTLTWERRGGETVFLLTLPKLNPR
jgi:signal transduction histidine kinase